MRILLVESNIRIASARKTSLGIEGFVVEHADTGEIALDLLRHYEFDLVLLNLDLPDMDGCSLISRSRTAGHDTPILAQTSTSQPNARIKALSAGSDDVVDHTMDPAELVARIRAIVRRSRGYSNPRLKMEGLSLDLERREVLANDIRVHLTAKEFEILQLLMLRKNSVLTKETILSHLYGGLDEPEMKIIDVFICKIRNKLAKAGLPKVIATVWGRGYSVRDAGPVDEIDHGSRIRQTPNVDRLVREFA